MTEADIPEGAKVRHTQKLRWLRQGPDLKLQQWVQVEDRKTMFFCWLTVPTATDEESD